MNIREGSSLINAGVKERSKFLRVKNHKQYSLSKLSSLVFAQENYLNDIRFLQNYMVPGNPFLHADMPSHEQHPGLFSFLLPMEENFETCLISDPAHFC